MEEELKVKEHRFRKLFDESNDAIFIHDLNGIILDTNRSAHEILGYPKQTLLAIPMQALHPKEEVPAFKKALQTIARKGTFRFESELKKADNTVINVDISSKIIDQEKGIVQSIARDISELKKTQEQLKHSQLLASLSKMTAGIANEVNNPLSSILLCSELVLRSNIPSQTRKDLRVIHDEAKRAAKIITDLLTYSRRAKPPMRCLDLNSVLTKVLDMRRYEERMQNISVSVNLSSGALYVKGSSSQLMQVFMNLMLNAEDALKESKGGKIIISTQIDKEWARVLITDNGTGIAEESLNQIFYPFFTTKQVGEGTGLGLSTCYGIVTAHGGLIHAENNEMGGATFIVELPLTKVRVYESLRQERKRASLVIT